MATAQQIPPLFELSPYFCDAVNRGVVQSEIEGGVHLRDVPAGTVLEVETQNRAYTIRYQGLGQALISGHPVFCPEPVLVAIHGSTWGGSMIKTGFIGRGMRLEFGHLPGAGVEQGRGSLPITTSVILDVRASVSPPPFASAPQLS